MRTVEPSPSLSGVGPRSLRTVTVALALSACTFDASISPDASIRCSSPDACPPGSTCLLALGRCVPTSSLDLTPPAIEPGSESLRIEPGPGNPLTPPLSLGPSSVAVVAFATTRPLARPAELVATPRLRCVGGTTVGLGVSFSCTLPPGESVPDGPVTFAAHVLSLGGELLVLPLGVSVEVDATPPPPPSVEDGRTTLQRNPWGSDETGGQPRLLVLGLPDSAPGAAFVEARLLDVTLGRAPVSPDGSFTLTLPPFDVSTVEASAIDGAGNRSAWVPVREVEWVATAGAKVPGESFGNPGVFTGVRALGPSLLRGDAPELGAGDGLATVDGQGPTIGGGGSWRRKVANTAMGNEEAAVTWDVARARAVRFGGGGTPVDLTLEWTGEDWLTPGVSDPEGDGRPRAVRGAYAWHDAMSRLTWIAGGTSAQGVLRDVWSWNGESWASRGDMPFYPLDGTAFYEAPARRLWICGGSRSGTPWSGCLTWSGATRRWEELPDAGFPGPRSSAAAVWDDDRGVAWLFGGLGPDGGALADFWRFDGQGWAPVVTDGGPARRSHGKLGVHRGRGLVVLVGGRFTGADTWVFDGTTWTPDTRPPIPARREGHTLFYDTANGRLMMTGGLTATWQWEPDAGWIARYSPSAAPGFNNGFTVACGPDAGCLVFTANPTLAVHQLAGSVFSAEPVYSGPDASIPTTTTEYAASAVCEDTETVDWIGRSTRAPAGTVQLWELSAPPRAWSAVVNDAGLEAFALDRPSMVCLPGGVRIVTAGRASGATQAVAAIDSDGGVSDLPLPEPLLDTSLAQGPVGVVSLAGISVDGGQQSAVAYQLTGTTWSSLPSPDSVRRGSRLVWDAARGALLLVGGTANLEGAPVLELTDGGWREVPIADPEGDNEPQGRRYPLVAWSPVRGRTLMTRGTPLGSANSLNDLWELEIAPYRPALVSRLSVASMRLPSAFTPRRLEVRAVVRAASELDGGAVDGAELGVFSSGAWRALPTTAASLPSGFQELRASWTDEAGLRALLRDAPEVGVGVWPAGVNGTGLAQLTVDYIEVRVRYLE